jgi:hypothetical protein
VGQGDTEEDEEVAHVAKVDNKKRRVLGQSDKQRDFGEFSSSVNKGTVSPAYKLLFVDFTAFFFQRHHFKLTTITLRILSLTLIMMTLTSMATPRVWTTGSVLWMFLRRTLRKHPKR